MPEQGRYKKVPRPESIETLISYLEGNKIVYTVEREENQVILVIRTNNPPIRVFMSNIYIVGLADVYEIMSKTDDLNAIVTMSGWNGYTSEAKSYCKEQDIGLFKFKEFMGAVYFHGEKYLDYIHPDERE